jgi:hypothetical protein
MVFGFVVAVTGTYTSVSEILSPKAWFDLEEGMCKCAKFQVFLMRESLFICCILKDTLLFLDEDYYFLFLKSHNPNPLGHQLDLMLLWSFFFVDCYEFFVALVYLLFFCKKL